MKFLKGLLVAFLIVVIVGGVGYIGYSTIFMGNMNDSGNGTTAANTTDTTANQGMQGMQAVPENDQGQKNNKMQQDNSQIAMNQSAAILQNKRDLDKAIALIDESQRLMTVDPYAPQESVTGHANDAGTAKTSPVTGQSAQESVPVTPGSGSQTTINIYPQGTVTGQAQIVQTDPSMQNMGTTYDANKMEQLHTGLYRLAIGRALLSDLDKEMLYQAENATAIPANPVQYYMSQYNQSVLNKEKLDQALSYVNEAGNLVNINPYASASGLVYDKDRMNKIHQSISKLAEGVASLNIISEGYTKQSMFLANAVQYQNNLASIAASQAANSMNNDNASSSSNNSSVAGNTNATGTQQMSHTGTTAGLFGDILNNINIGFVINLLITLFVVGLAIGIFGFILSLLKTPSKERI